MRTKGKSGGALAQARRAGVRVPYASMRALHAGGRARRGQSTVEFAVVTAGFLALVVALGVMWRAFGDGLLVEHALAVASHHVQAVLPTTVADIFLY